jgi:hypothetical protein
MLLRTAPTPDRDPDIFHTMTSHTPAQEPPIPNNNNTNHHEETHQNNSLDDIWGTSPPTHHHHHHHPHPHQPYHQPHQPYHHHDQQQHPSDIPRLSHAHTTAGYRDGIALAKSRTAQAGFDEGYGLGATIGARAGQLLGVLEGLAAAVGLHSLSLSQHQHQGAQGQEEAARLGGLLAEARRELSVRGGVFGPEYFWEGDGNWRYVVVDDEAERQGGGGGGVGEARGVVFADVAEAHPLVRKWDGIVRGEADRYGVDLEVLKDEVGPGEALGRRDDGEEEEEQQQQQQQRGVNRARRDGGSKPAARGGAQLAW